MANNRGSIGGKDSSGKNDWDVDDNGDIIPGTTGVRSIGSTSKKVKEIIADAATITTVTAETLTIGDLDIIVSGTTLYFNGAAVTTA